MKKIHTDQAPKAVGPYSQAIVSNNMVFVSGQIPFNPQTMKAPESIEDQTKQSLENVKAILEEAGSSLEKVVKVSIFIKDMNDFAKINEVYSQYFTNHKPARACVEVARMPKDVKIEIEAIGEV